MTERTRSIITPLKVNRLFAEFSLMSLLLWIKRKVGQPIFASLWTVERVLLSLKLPAS